MTILANVLSLLLACLVGVGPIALVAMLQNRRDRRAKALLDAVAAELPAEALRSDVAIDVRCRLLSRRATVRLDLGHAPATRIWETAARLRRDLPGWVHLEMDGYLDDPLTVTRPFRLTVEDAQPQMLRRAARPPRVLAADRRPRRRPPGSRRLTP
jgi:hypothetical protein